MGNVIMLDIMATNVADAVSIIAKHLHIEGSRYMFYGNEWAKLSSPMVIDFAEMGACSSRYLSLGNPFEHLLSSFAWMFPAQDGSIYPKIFDPRLRMPESASPAAIAAKILTDSRQVIQVGDYLATFEMHGTPENHGVLEMNIVVSVGSTFEALVPWGIRWSMLHQAVCASIGIIAGRSRMFILHPCAPVTIVDAVYAEFADNDFGFGPTGSVPVVSGSYDDWYSDALMFVSEHCSAVGYKDRYIRRVLNPAMAAWRYLCDPELPPEARVKHARDMIKNIGDEDWKMVLDRFAVMQSG